MKKKIKKHVYNWVQNEDGSFTDLNQRYPIEKLVAWQEDLFWFSNYLYYKLDSPVFKDDEYDHIVHFLEDYYELCSDELKNLCDKGAIKASAYMMMELDDRRMQGLIDWLQRIKRNDVLESVLEGPTI